MDDSRGDRDNGDGDRRQEGSSIGPCTDRVIRHASYLVDGIGQPWRGRGGGGRGEGKRRRGEGNDRGERATIRNRARLKNTSRTNTYPPSRARRCWNVLAVCVFITDSRESI